MDGLGSASGGDEARGGGSGRLQHPDARPLTASDAARTASAGSSRNRRDWPARSGHQLQAGRSGTPAGSDPPDSEGRAHPTRSEGNLPPTDPPRQKQGPSFPEIPRIEVDYSLVFEGVPGAYLLIRPDLTIAAANRAYLRAMRMRREAIVGRDVCEVLGEYLHDPGGETEQALRASLHRVLRTATTDEMGVYRCDHGLGVTEEVVEPGREEVEEGETYWNAVNSPLLNAQGKIAYILHRIDDVTSIVKLERSTREQKRAADELFVRSVRLRAESEERFRSVFDQQFQFMALLDPLGRMTDVNDLALAATGATREEVIGRPFWEARWWRDLPELQAAWPRRLEQAARQEGPLLTHDEYRNAEGEVRFVEGATTAVRDHEGHVRFFIVQASDCTERKHAEMALQESERRMATLVSSLPGMAYRCCNDRKWTKEFVSRGVEQLTGYSPDDFLSGRIDWTQLQHPDDIEWTWQAVQQAIAARRPFELEFRIRHRDGSWRWVWERGEAVYDDDGKVVALEGFVTDVSERKRAEVQAEALAVTGRELSASLDYEQTITSVTRAVVPLLADCCAVDIIDIVEDEEDAPAASLRRLATTHTTPQKEQIARTIMENYPPGPDAPYGASFVVRTGIPQLLKRVPDSLLQARALDEEHLRLLRELDVSSYICVPLAARDRTFGAMTFVMLDSGRTYDERDLEVAVEIGRRAAQAIDNARLHRDLLESQKRLHFALRGSSAGVWSMNTETGQGSWSEEFLPLYGFKPSTPRRYSRWLRSLHPEDRKLVHREFQALLRSTRNEFQIEFRTIHPVRGQRWILSMGRVERDPQGKAIRVDGIHIDITERKEHEEQMRVVMGELNHRVKNTLAVIQSIARQTIRRSPDLPTFQRSFEDRLQAIAAAHGLLTRTDWQGVSLEDIVASELNARAPSKECCTLSGPPVTLRPKAALAMHMVVHELTTNAVKHGGLRSEDGSVRITWREQENEHGPVLIFEWLESTPDPGSPGQTGFGSRLIDQLVEYELQGDIERRFTPAGLQCLIRIPLTTSAVELHPLFDETPDAAGRARVLIVEDSLPLAMSMREDLEGLGYSVIGPAGTLSRAMRLADHERPAAAVLDVNLGDEKVYPLARKLRDEGVPILLVTGYESADLPGDLRDLPLLNKPIAVNRIEQFLEQGLHNGGHVAT